MGNLFQGRTAHAQTNKLDSQLFVAVKANDLEKVKELVKKGADVNATDHNNWTPIFYSCFDDSN